MMSPLAISLLCYVVMCTRQKRARNLAMSAALFWSTKPRTVGCIVTQTHIYTHTNTHGLEICRLYPPCKFWTKMGLRVLSLRAWQVQGMHVHKYTTTQIHTQCVCVHTRHVCVCMHVCVYVCTCVIHLACFAKRWGTIRACIVIIIYTMARWLLFQRPVDVL